MRFTALALLALACDPTPAPSPATAPSAEPAAVAREAGPVLLPAVAHRDGVPPRVSPPGTAQVVELARGDKAFLGVLTLAPDARVPEHQDPTEEYLYVLSGGGTITIDGHQAELRPGVGVFMPAGATVSYVNGPEVTEVVQVFAGPEPADKYASWEYRAEAP